jgi:hypothetical protein
MKTIQLTLDVDFPSQAGTVILGDDAVKLTRRDGPRSNDLLITYYLRASSAVVSGGMTWLLLQQLSRWWRATNVSISWVPRNDTDSGLVHLAAVRAEEANRVVSPAMIESYPTSVITKIGKRATLTLT